jgi:hypothetical protein
MMNLKELIGKNVKIQISEPWDFELPKSGNIFKGIIQGVCKAPKEKNWEKEDWLISVTEPFSWKGEKVFQVLVSSRYEQEKIEDILKNTEVTVGLLRVRTGVTLQNGMNFLANQVEYFAIGTLSLQKIKGDSHQSNQGTVPTKRDR